jgi:hypothetical protein
MTRFLDSLAGTLAGLLIGVVLVGAIAPGAWVVIPTPRPAPESAPAALPGSSTTEGSVTLPSRDALARTEGPRQAPRSLRAVPPVRIMPVVAVPAAAGTISGLASFVAPSYGPRYLALPDGPGITARICGPVACVVRTSTDAGPDRAMQRAGRVADLSFRDFAAVCGCDPWAVGLVRVVVTPIPEPPPTSTRETP